MTPAIQNPTGTTEHAPVTGAKDAPILLILNQMAGPMTWELAEDLGKALGPVALLTGHPDTLARGSQKNVSLYPAAPYRRGSYPRRMLSWLHYVVQAFFWLWLWPAGVPLLLFSNPPMLPWLGYLLYRLRGQAYSVMVHDIYPDVIVRSGILPNRHPAIRVWRWLNRLAYEHAGVVMTLGECMADNLARQFDPAKTRAGRIEIIYPWVDTNLIRPIPKAENWFARQYGQVDKLTVMYSGNMGLAHDLETMLAAAEQLQDTPGIHFMFIGAGPKWEWVQDTIQAKQLTNVTLLPWQPEDVVPYSLATADIGLVSLDELARGLAFPSKTVALMAAGAAIIGLSNEPSDLQVVIERSQCGINVELGNTEGLLKVLLKFLDKTFSIAYGQAAQLAAERDFSRESNSHHLIKIMAAYL